MIALVLFLHETCRLLYKHQLATLSRSETLKIPTQTDTIALQSKICSFWNMWAAGLRFNFYTEGESSGFLACVTPFSSYTVSWLVLSKCLQTNSGLPCKIQVTVSNQSNHETREAASSLWPISASVIQQSPGATLEPVGEGIFFLWRLVQSHPIQWTTLEQYARDTSVHMISERVYCLQKVL